eukprot:TRINITY_DN63979_c0_g1_i1.p1 TRINITY_DN63979_c0_g1~~TRINITY_DN63979_c0_g1_i1.p1  ORF type:complete len:645 (+),score=89.38 TRINITY_DN63979_c0_g1_i1:57-1991(+)
MVPPPHNNSTAVDISKNTSVGGMGEGGGDVTKDIEQMMQKLSTSQIKASPTVTKVKKVEDYLDAAEKNATHYHPTYAKKTPSPTKKGFSFGSPSKAGDKRFISKDLAKHQYLSTHSPGPKYTPSSFTDNPKHAQSFPRAPRLKETKKADQVPGPQYEIPGTVGRQLTRESAPAYKMGQCPRFQDGEYISAAHSKGVPSKETPAPNAYAPDPPTEQGPSFSFTTAGSVKPGKIFLSKQHAQHEAVGTNSPGPMYLWSPTLISKKPPAFGFGTSERDPRAARSQSTPPRVGGSPKKREDDAPGPGSYFKDNKEFLETTTTPAWSLGALDNPKANRFNGRALVRGVGEGSPGPQYNPDDKAIRKQPPGSKFADNDPMAASIAKRGSEKQFISPELSTHYMAGKSSPGPAVYDQKLPSGGAPAYSMGRKEKILMKRVCPAPERARFISKELAKENMGAYSPGPKYKIPETMGIGGQYSLKFSFGTSDRAFEDVSVEVKEKLGTVDKPYTAPSEARYISKELQKSGMMGKHSPGPKYRPKYNLVQKEPPAHTIQGKRKDKFTVPTKEEYEEEKEKIKGTNGPPTNPREKKAPSFTISKSNRGLLQDKAGEKGVPGRNTIGRDSPGPVYKPSFTAVDAKVKGGPCLGGLR